MCHLAPKWLSGHTDQIEGGGVMKTKHARRQGGLELVLGAQALGAIGPVPTVAGACWSPVL